MSKTLPIITMADVHLVEGTTTALVKSMSQDDVLYEVDWDAKTCNCNGFVYSKKDPKECKHLTSVLRFRAILGIKSPTPP